MYSMTGFGRSKSEDNGRRLTVEIKSVNHRFLDINIKMPRTLLFAEDNIRNLIKRKLSRGRIDVFINYTDDLGEGKKAVADIGLLRSYINAARQAAVQMGIDDDLALSHIIKIPDIISIEEETGDEEILQNILSKAVNDAVDALIDMRLTEGTELKKSIEECIDTLLDVCGKIEECKAKTAGEYAEKLRKRINDLISGLDIDETRFTTEVALMADRADITEEIVRLYAHIGQIKQTLENGNAAGRKLDFLVQELNREINTIGSKSYDFGITALVVEAKTIVEKIREQVQNIE